MVNNRFKTKLDLLNYLLEDIWDIVLSNEMQSLIDNSKEEDFINYEDYKKWLCSK
jgi:hypothetical protein